MDGASLLGLTEQLILNAFRLGLEHLWWPASELESIADEIKIAQKRLEDNAVVTLAGELDKKGERK